MRETKQFDAFGKTYLVKQFSAAEGFDYLAHGEAARKDDPIALLRHTSVRAAGGWLCLSSRAAINEYVRDEVEFLHPMLVLDGLLGIVSDFSFDFLNVWKPVKFPRRLLSDTSGWEPLKEVHPIMASLTAGGKATIKELEQYYSLSDAFKLYDVISSEALKQAVAQEKAAREAAEEGRRRKR